MISLQLILKNRINKAIFIWFYICSQTKLKPVLITCRFIMVIKHNTCMMKTMIMNNCAEDRLMTAKHYLCNRKETCTNAPLIAGGKLQTVKMHFYGPTVSHHMKYNWASIFWPDSQHEIKIIWHKTILCEIWWFYIQTAHIYEKKEPVEWLEHWYEQLIENKHKPWDPMIYAAEQSSYVQDLFCERIHLEGKTECFACKNIL